MGISPEDMEALREEGRQEVRRSLVPRCASICAVTFMASICILTLALLNRIDSNHTVPIPASAERKPGSIRVGDVGEVLRWQWVEIVNAKPIASANNTFGPGHRVGGIDAPGTVKVLRIMDADHFVVEYTHDDKDFGGPAAGTRLPTGAVFYITREEFLPMMTKHRASLNWLAELTGRKRNEGVK